MLCPPSAPGTDLDPSSAELASKDPGVNTEVGGDHLERFAAAVAGRGLSNGAIGHRSAGLAMWDAEPIEVADRRGAVDGEAPSQRLDR